MPAEVPGTPSGPRSPGSPAQPIGRAHSHSQWRAFDGGAGHKTEKYC